MLDLFGGISTGLATVLQAGIRVHQYLYVEKDEASRRASLRHVASLVYMYPDLLPNTTIRAYQHQLLAYISLLGVQDLTRVGEINLVIARWPCQGHSTAGQGGGLQDHRSAMFWEMIRVSKHLQDNQVHPPAYILENVPLLGDA
jgi:site-specific DNA-cytosine methylase